MGQSPDATDRPSRDDARLRALSTSLRFVEAVRREGTRLSRRLRAGQGEQVRGDLEALIEGLRSLGELLAELDGAAGGRSAEDRGLVARVLRDLAALMARGDWLGVAERIDGVLMPAAPRWQHLVAARLEAACAARPEPATGDS